MNQTDWSKWSAIAEILSAIAIVVTLLYLAVQTRYLAVQTEQNNSLLEAQASYNYYRGRADSRDALFRDEELAEFYMRLEAGDPLSSVEARRLQANIEAMFLAWQFEWGRYSAGNLVAAELPLAGWRQIMSGERMPGSVAIWDNFKEQLRPDFVEWVESEISGD